VLVSPLIAPGTVFRVPEGATPLDHTCVLKTVETRWGLAPLTARDAAAQHVGAVITLARPRTDDVLAAVVVPVSGAASPAAGEISHLQQVHADLLAREFPAGAGIPTPRTAQEAIKFIRQRTAADTVSRQDA
jgi:phospholipase C